MPGYNKALPYWARQPAFPCGEKKPLIAKMSKSTARILRFEYLAGIVSLLVAGVGQYMLSLDMFPHPAPKLVAISGFIFLLPIYAVWLPVFCNQPLLPFQTYVRWCFYASCCTVGATLLFEFYHALGLLPVRDANMFLIARSLMHLGWISFVPQLHYWILSRKQSTS